ncbi:ATP-binding protein [Sphingomonas sp.]|uniref:ATP-binding protein n=1 Tax=Sphingomonas sp. TaxID=28214 RepID=UPI003CC540F0
MATIAAGQGAAAGQPATWPVDAARDSDEPFRTLAATMPGICWLARQDGRIYWMNGHGRDFFGTTERNPFAALHPDDRPATLAAWRLAAAQGHAFEATTRLRAPDGSWRPFLTRAEPVHDEAGSVLRWCGVQLDLSDQQRRQSHDAFFRAVSDAVRDESDPTRIIAVIAGLLEAHLAVGRVLYLETDGDPGRFTVSVNGTLRQAEVEYRPPAGFAAMLTAFGAGHTVATPDAGIVGGLITAGVRQFLLDHQARAGIGVPLVKDGRLVAILAAADPAPRRWTPEEVALIEELAELTWSTVTRARAVATLRERERQQAFMIAWSDAVRHKPSVHAILATTLDLLGRQLGAARLTYVEADARSVALAVDQHGGNATDPPRPPLPIAALGRRVVAHHLDERLLAVADVRDHPLFDGDNLPAFEAAGVRAFVAVPLVRHGKLAALLSAQADQPRAWTAAEVRLMAEVADRAWPMLQRARFEERLAESEAQLAAFMEHAPVGMHLKDRDGRYLRVNPELAVAVGRPMDELVGQHPDALFPDDMAARIVAMEARALAGSPVAEEFATASTDRYATLLSIVFPIGDDARKTGGFTLDLTERKAAEAALQRSRDALYQSEKLSALGSLLAGVSHELNNPLSIVVAQAVMMERHAEGTALADRALKIRKAADRCARIVQTFLAMARQKKPERSAVDLNAVANGAIELASYGLRSDGVGITRALAVDLPHISADSDQLHQIVTNLIVNAQQAMAGVGSLRWLEVRTALGPEPRTVILEVADSGPGIPPDMRRRVFEPFYTTKPQGEGTGVGLSFSQGLAEAHGGRLTLVPSERGACFRLTLPLDERDLLPRVEPTAAKPAAAAHRRALLVDDEEEIALSLADFLSLEGFECEVVVGGAAAQARLAQGQHYDLVVSDIRMPDVDGPALYAWIAVQRPDLAAHTAFTTGDTLGTAAARFLADARRPVLEKPFMPDSIRHFLAELELA